MALPADPYAIFPEPLRTVARDAIARDRRLYRVLSGGLVVLAGALASYAAWYAFIRGGDAQVPGLVGLVGMAAGAAWMASTFRTDARLTSVHREDNRVTGKAYFARYGAQTFMQIPVIHGNRLVRGHQYLHFDIPANAPLEALQTATTNLARTLETPR